MELRKVTVKEVDEKSILPCRLIDTSKRTCYASIVVPGKDGGTQAEIDHMN